jgi:hypothetical protein
MAYDRPGVNIANSIHMKRRLHSDAVVLVEGDDDSQLLGRHLARCRIVVAHGRPHLLDAVEHLNRIGVAGIVGLVDSDFWELDGDAPQTPNLVRTDGHDIEMMLLASPALDHVLGELGTAEQINSFQQARGTDVRTALLGLATPLGCLRWLSHKNTLGLNFDKLALDDFISEKKLTADDDLMLHTVFARSVTTGRLEMVRHELAAAIASAPDPFHVCCGHDCVDVLGIALRRVLGHRTDAEVSRDRLERALRLAFESRYFESTRVSRSLVAWQAASGGYVLIRAASPPPSPPGPPQQGVP